MSQTALSLIKGALRKIQSYQSGETISQFDQSDCLETLNDMLDMWSNDHASVFARNENIFNWINGKAQYSVGNPLCTDIGESGFSGTLTGGSPTITGVTNIPTDLKAGATLTDVANVIPAGTTVLSIGATTVTMSANATSTPSTGTDTITYTIPGDFVMQRPLRITSGYTRINNLDFTLKVVATEQEYNSILYKAQPGPWPTIAWYNPQMPYGLLNVYMTPGQSAAVHLFSDVILSNLTLNQTFILPQGYALALKLNLALQLWPEYVSMEPPFMLLKLAKEAYDSIKDLNRAPQVEATYDSELLRGNRPDGGFIFHGGYRS